MGKPETLGLLRSLAGSCSEVPEGWCKGHDNCGACWNDALDMLEKELDDYAELPKDANEVSVSPGDDIHIDHNDKVRHVVSMTLCEDGAWLVHCDSGGGFVMPASKEYVTHHHAPTVEDVLRDACTAYHSLMVEGMSDVAHDMPAPSEIIAEYAAKLRLAVDAS